MISNGGRRVTTPKTLEVFDPRRSAEVASELLARTAAPHALIGRLAVWAYVPVAEQQMTKDIDFAVPAARIADLEAAARSTGLEVRPLRIGGIAARSAEGVRIDFIHRAADGVAPLFEDAIAGAPASGVDVTIGSVRIAVVGIEHLLAMKLVSGEPKDDQDARTLLRRPDLDYPRARALVARFLGPVVAGRLDAVARDVGRPEVAPRGEYES